MKGPLDFLMEAEGIKLRKCKKGKPVSETEKKMSYESGIRR